MSGQKMLMTQRHLQTPHVMGLVVEKITLIKAEEKTRLFYWEAKQIGGAVRQQEA
jgi:hypothetical protein